MESLDSALARLPLKHQLCLKWFIDSEGKEFKVHSKMVPGAIQIVDKSRPIIPANWMACILTVRSGDNDSGKWAFGQDATWTITIPRNNESLSDDADSLIKSFVLNWKDRIPIGVFKQIGDQIMVEGLGIVLSILPDAVVIGSVDSRGMVPQKRGNLREELRQVARMVQKAEAEDQKSVWKPKLDSDTRAELLSEVARRQGQPDFRLALLEAYGSTCAITGCKVTQVLEAAHIVPYAGQCTNDIHNGILLRADIHALFDLGLIEVNEASYTVMVSEELQHSDYAKLDGKPLQIPVSGNHRPSREAFQVRRNLLFKG